MGYGLGRGHRTAPSSPESRHRVQMAARPHSAERLSPRRSEKTRLSSPSRPRQSGAQVREGGGSQAATILSSLTRFEFTFLLSAFLRHLLPRDPGSIPRKVDQNCARLTLEPLPLHWSGNLYVDGYGVEMGGNVAHFMKFHGLIWIMEKTSS